MSKSPHINQLREHLMATLAGLRDRQNPMEPDRARAVAQVAGVLVDTAKVEIDYLKATGQDRSDFLEQPADTAVAQLGHEPASGYTQGTVERLPGVTRHRLNG
ncbi:MAG: hypothetical protein ACRECD_13950 [Burkholderiaceae bacterium]